MIVSKLEKYANLGLKFYK